MPPRPKKPNHKAKGDAEADDASSSSSSSSSSSADASSASNTEGAPYTIQPHLITQWHELNKQERLEVLNLTSFSLFSCMLSLTSELHNTPLDAYAQVMTPDIENKMKQQFSPQTMSILSSYFIAGIYANGHVKPIAEISNFDRIAHKIYDEFQHNLTHIYHTRSTYHTMYYLLIILVFISNLHLFLRYPLVLVLLVVSFLPSFSSLLHTVLHRVLYATEHKWTNVRCEIIVASLYIFMLCWLSNGRYLFLLALSLCTYGLTLFEKHDISQQHLQTLYYVVFILTLILHGFTLYFCWYSTLLFLTLLLLIFPKSSYPLSVGAVLFVAALNFLPRYDMENLPVISLVKRIQNHIVRGIITTCIWCVCALFVYAGIDGWLLWLLGWCATVFFMPGFLSNLLQISLAGLSVLLLQMGMVSLIREGIRLCATAALFGAIVLFAWIGPPIINRFCPRYNHIFNQPPRDEDHED